MVTGQEHSLLMATCFSCVTTINVWLISGCHKKSWNGAVWSWFPASSGQLSSIRRSLAQWPCWGIPQQVSCGYGGISWVCGRVYHCGLFPSDGVVILPSIFCYCWRLQHPSRAGIPVLLQSGLKSSLGLTNVGLATGNPVHHLGLILHWQGVLYFGHPERSACRTSKGDYTWNGEKRYDLGGA